MAFNFTILLIFILAYLIGSIPPSYIIGKLFFKVDIRTQGSGNAGGANSIRLFGKKTGIAIGLFDVIKGYAVIVIAKLMYIRSTIETGIFSDVDNVYAIAGFLAIFGHCFSLFLKFTGGKGGATTAGVIFAVDPFTGIMLVIFWLIIVVSTRFTSLANLLGVLIIPSMFNYRTVSAYFTMSILLVILIYYTHRANISRLVNGSERKFGEKEQIITQY